MAILESARNLQLLDTLVEKYLPGSGLIQFCRGLTRKTVFFLSAGSIIFLSYAAFWSIWYRLPVSPPSQIDFRHSKLEKPYYVSFCSSLAANPIGFPGHSFVVWSENPPKDLINVESYGFAPSYVCDQIPSLFKVVPGAIGRTDSKNNLRNLDRLTVVVNQSQFEKTQELRKNWRSDNFRAGVRDCVAFSKSIALNLGLKVPNTPCIYPQDYLHELKRLNAK